MCVSLHLYGVGVGVELVSRHHGGRRRHSSTGNLELKILAVADWTVHSNIYISPESTLYTRNIRLFLYANRTRNFVQ
jgi:hypothetical protein